MPKLNAIILRITGIIFFTAAITCALPVLERTVDSYAFFIASDNVSWGLFYLFTAALFTSFFIMALFSCGIGAIFAGNSPYKQAVWNCGIYALVLLSLFTTILLQTGVEHNEEQILYICLIGIPCLIVYNVIVFLCLKNTEEFNFKNLIPSDSGCILSIKVYVGMLIAIQIIAFLYAHKLVDL